MAIHPDPSFPLLPKDQADVIRIFLELMREGDRTGRTPEAIANKPFGPHYGDADRSPNSGDLLEFD